MDFYEVGVYLVIVIVASTSVFGVIWLLIRSMTPRRPKRRRKMVPALAGAGNRPGTGSRTGESADRKKRKGKDKKEKGRKDGLLELKELPDSKMLQAGGDKSEKGKDIEKKAKPEEEKKYGEKEAINAAVTATTAATAGAAGEATNQEGGEVMLPELPSMDTLTEEEQEMPKEEIDLMSVFESEDAEDSASSDLAANLFDVDVANIERLGNEVSQFLSRMR